MKKIFLLFVCIILVVLGSVSRGIAEYVTFGFSGVVNYIGEVGSAPATDGSILIGTEINGQFTFDLSTPDFRPDLTNQAYYVVDSFIVNIGNYIATTASPQIEIWDNYNGYDLFHITKSGPVVFTNGIDTFETGSPQGDVHVFRIPMYDNDQTIFSSTDLPIVPPDLQEIENMFFTIAFGPDMSNYTNITANISELTLVPEPISSTLFIVGGATLGFRRFMRRKLA